jgi:hypothetical protein
VTNDAHGSPSAVSVANVPVLVDAAIVRACSAADGRTDSATAVSGGGTDGALARVAVITGRHAGTIPNTCVVAARTAINDECVDRVNC